MPWCLEVTTNGCLDQTSTYCWLMVPVFSRDETVIATHHPVVLDPKFKINKSR